nr:hypothetical protein [Arthrobacter sp. SLBN-100]
MIQEAQGAEPVVEYDDQDAVDGGDPPAIEPVGASAHVAATVGVHHERQ